MLKARHENNVRNIQQISEKKSKNSLDIILLFNISIFSNCASYNFV